MRISHYIFFGRGDYLLSSVPLDAVDPRWRRPAEISRNPADWTFSWDLPVWRQRLDLLKSLGSNRLYLFLNAFELPYASRKYPKLIESDHANVRQEFLPALLDYANNIGMEVIAGMSSTGHCDRALQIYPELAGEHADGNRWQCAMCHNNSLSRNFVRELNAEILERYHGFSGVFIHPPEVGEYCHCGYCRDLYLGQTGRALLKQDESTRMSWFWTTATDFLATLFDQVRTHDPGLELHTCTIPGVWRRHFDIIAPLLPKQVQVLHWCYGRLDESAREQLAADLRTFGGHGHRLSFANSLIFSCSTMNNHELRENNHANNQIAHSLGVEEIVYFLGPVWQEDRIIAGSVRPD